MAEDLLQSLKTIDPSILTEVVRQDQNDPLFIITEWDVKRLSDKGIMNPDGLWLFSGAGNGGKGIRSWRVVLKILKREEQESPPSDLWYWKRELLWVQSELMKRLPGPIKAPRFYKTEETTDGAWLWQEYVENQRPSPWALEDYAFVARQLGQWHGAYLAGEQLPAEPWFTQQHYRSWCAQANPEQDFQFPLNQKYIVGELKNRYDQLWIEREKFYHVLATLPQTFSHFDSQRRNLFIRKGEDGEDELVLVDWAVCGLGPLGAELYSLIGMSTALLEWPASDVTQLDQAAFRSYLQGLSEAGWSGNIDMIRLAYTCWITVWFGVVFPNLAAFWCNPDFRLYALQQFGSVDEELYLKWLPLLPYSLDCADEARILMKKLGFG